MKTISRIDDARVVFNHEYARARLLYYAYSGLIIQILFSFAFSSLLSA